MHRAAPHTFPLLTLPSRQQKKHPMPVFINSFPKSVPQILPHLCLGRGSILNCLRWMGGRISQYVICEHDYHLQSGLVWRRRRRTAARDNEVEGVVDGEAPATRVVSLIRLSFGEDSANRGEKGVLLNIVAHQGQTRVKNYHIFSQEQTIFLREKNSRYRLILY